MTDTMLQTVWTGHWREAEFLGFVRWALGQDGLRDQFAFATNESFRLAADPVEMQRQVDSGEALAYLHRFTDWLATNVFGTPDDMIDEIPKDRKETLH